MAFVSPWSIAGLQSLGEIGNQMIHRLFIQVNTENRRFLFVDIPGPFFYITLPDLQLPMYLRGPNQIVIITGIHRLMHISRKLFLRLKTLNNDYKHNSIDFICQVCDNKIFLI